MHKTIAESPGFRSLTKHLTGFNDGLVTKIPDNWRQGRTAYGGVTAGLSFAAIEKSNKTLPDLRSASVNFIGPVTGHPHFKTQLLRKGRNVTSVRVDTYSVNEEESTSPTTKPTETPLVCTANLVFGADRQSPLTLDHYAPNARPPEDCVDLIPEGFQAFVPNYIHNFDVKTIEGDPPLSGSKKNGYMRCWARHKDPQSRTGVDSFLCLADVLFPAAMPMLTQVSAVSSVSWMINIINNPITEDGWWQIETKLSASHNGYSSQIMRYWNSENILIAEAIQNVAIF